MGIEQFDFLYRQAQTMLSFFASMQNTLNTVIINQNGIAGKINSVSGELETALSQIDDLDVDSAKFSIGAIKQALREVAPDNIKAMEVKAAVTQATELVNALIPLITQEVEKYYDGKTVYHYKCEECSIRCSLPLKCLPLDEKILKTCLLKGDKSASFYQESIESITP